MWLFRVINIEGILKCSFSSLTKHVSGAQGMRQVATTLGSTATGWTETSLWKALCPALHQALHGAAHSPPSSLKKIGPLVVPIVQIRKLGSGIT